MSFAKTIFALLFFIIGSLVGITEIYILINPNELQTEWTSNSRKFQFSKSMAGSRRLFSLHGKLFGFVFPVSKRFGPKKNWNRFKVNLKSKIKSAEYLNLMPTLRFGIDKVSAEFGNFFAFYKLLQSSA